MKRINKVLIFILLLFPTRVNALTGNIKLNCSPTTITNNTNIICNITATSDEEISGLSADIVLSNNIEYVNFISDPSWQGDATGNKIGLYTSENKKGTFNVGTLTLKVKDNVFDSNESISLNNCIYSDKNFVKFNITKVESNIRVPAENNKLKSLEISPGKIEFSKDKLEYNLSLDSHIVSITATPEDSKSTLSGDTGSKELEYGLNIFKLNVTSENGNIRTYTINITRNDTRGTENRISKLTIEGYKINFDSDKGEYNLTVENNVTSINISSILTDENSTYIKGYEPGEKQLEVGLNKIEIKVSAENGSTRTYKINITRKDVEKSSDNYLEDIKLDSGNINFDKETEEYKMSVSFDTENIKIDTKTSSDKAKVEVSGNENLKIGENTITVKVTAEDETVREYKIIVTRKEEPLSNNYYLKSLIIDNYEIDFNKETYTYNIKIKDEEKLNITAKTEDKNANILIKDNENLKDGSVIKITVTAEDGSKKDYKINITKKKKVNYILITVIIELIIIASVITIIEIRAKKKEKNGQI